jgi:hypothetical protein
VEQCYLISGFRIKGADQPDQLTAQSLMSATEAKLATKGLTKTDSDNADLYIGYQTAVGTEKQFRSYNAGWGYGSGWGGGWYGYGGMTSSTTYGPTSTVYVGQLDLEDEAAVPAGEYDFVRLRFLTNRLNNDLPVVFQNPCGAIRIELCGDGRRPHSTSVTSKW